MCDTPDCCGVSARDIPAPITDLSPRVKQVLKPTYPQTFVTQLSVKALHLRVLCRLARLNMHQFNLLLQTPSQKMPAGQLGTVVTANPLRLASPHHDLVQHPCYPSAGKARVDFQCQALSGKRIDHAQHPIFRPAANTSCAKSRAHSWSRPCTVVTAPPPAYSAFATSGASTDRPPDRPGTLACGSLAHSHAPTAPANADTRSAASRAPTAPVAGVAHHRSAWTDSDSC